jgi:Flp pilus assembly protein TadG
MMRRARKEQGARQRPGAACLELAVVAPVFFLIVFGMIEIGRALMVTHLFTHAARQGCRVGVIEGKSTSDIQTAVANALTAQGISSDTVTVQVNDGSADASSAKPGDEITVLVSVPVSSVTWLPGGGFLSGNLSSQYTLRRE